MYTLQAVACLTGHVDHVAKSHGTVLWSSYHGVYQLMGILNSMKMDGWPSPVGHRQGLTMAAKLKIAYILYRCLWLYGFWQLNFSYRFIDSQTVCLPFLYRQAIQAVRGLGSPSSCSSMLVCKRVQGMWYATLELNLPIAVKTSTSVAANVLTSLHFYFTNQPTTLHGVMMFF